LNPNFQPQNQGIQQAWQNPLKAALPTNLPQFGWPQRAAGAIAADTGSASLAHIIAAPAGLATSSQAQPQLGWPTTAQSQPQNCLANAGNVAAENGRQFAIRNAVPPREPQLFPGPYSAEVPASHDY